MTTTEVFETLMPEPFGYVPFPGEFYPPDELDGDVKDDPFTTRVYSAAQMRAMFDAATERAAKLYAEQITHIRSVRNDSVEDMRSEIELLRDFHSFFKDRGEFLYAHFGMAPIDLYNKCGLNSAAIRARDEGVTG